jgi:hypothetical protein
MDLSPNQGKKKKLKTSNFAQTIKQTTPASNSINLWPTQHQIESIDQKKKLTNNHGCNEQHIKQIKQIINQAIIFRWLISRAWGWFFDRIT